MTVAPTPIPVVRRRERFASVPSTNDVVRGWLASGEPEVCLAVADEQTAGRGRNGRTWIAPAGHGLLLSLGFRPAWLEPDRVWRLAATVSLAMAQAAEETAGLPDRSIRLKWPNDLVVVVDRTGRALQTSGESRTMESPSTQEGPAPGVANVRKLGGVLGETDGLGTGDPRAVVGIGLNADWPADNFPTQLAGAMASLRSAAGGRPIDTTLLLDGFLSRLEARIEELHGGSFDGGEWVDRQVTTGREIEVVLPDGATQRSVATGVDAMSGALRITDATSPTGERSLVVGEIRHIRLATV